MSSPEDPFCDRVRGRAYDIAAFARGVGMHHEGLSKLIHLEYQIDRQLDEIWDYTCWDCDTHEQ
jgi:hypothetical protein